jgi:diguanylate cyclase (GGDEF)-like protein
MPIRGQMQFNRDLKAVGAFVARHRYRFIDFTSVAVATILVLYAGMTFDIFANAPNHKPAADTLEFDELLATVVILFLGLLWAIRRMLRERRETARRAAAEREIRILAFHDPLTDLPNRRQFDEALKAAVAAPPRAGASHGVLLLDLNRFKRINDVYGHPTGDEVLVHVATRLIRAVRDGDLVARLGGDEFAVLATHLPSPETATGLALRIIEGLRNTITTHSGEHLVGAAIGIALAPQDGNSPAELLRKADIALYRAKEQNASAMRFFEPAMDAQVRERDRLERDLRKAINASEILSLYQPLIDLKSGQVRAFEVMARWTHSEMGEIAPERFISIAEDSGLISKLSDTLLTKACGDARQWRSEVELAFRVSPVLLRDPALPQRILEILRTTDFPPYRLELGITESALVRDLDAAQRIFGGLREAGVRIALDDFGTGYTSLYHLRNFKLDKIKIDRTFVEAMARDPESDTIVRALVGLGSGLGLEVTAEGVDSEEQRQMLITHGCNQAQGAFYGGAVSAANALALMGRYNV